MKRYFNLSRYKKLLKLKENGKITFMDSELLHFKASLEMQIIYNERKYYFSLIEKYLSKSINLFDFHNDFLKMEKKDSRKASRIINDFQALETFRLEKDIEKFNDLIDKISDLCFDYYDEWTETLERMPESDFYNLLSHYYLQLSSFKSF